MTAFPKYPAYKPSGVEWLGDVPEHWEVERLKGSLLEVDQRSTTGTETLLSLRMNVGLVPHNEVSTLPITSAQLIGYKKVAPGQVVMNRMRASSGIFAVATSHGLVSPDYAVFQPRGKQGTDYLLSLFKTGPMMTEFRRYSTGLGTGESGFLRLYSNFFFNIRCPIPPKAEEDRIVAFLDEKTAEIDRLIAKKQRQIELLDEQKAILINRAVTRGLHPQAELQDSGIPWFGPIPKGWKVSRLKHECSHIVDCPHATPVYDPEGEFPAIRTSDVSPGETHYEQAKRVGAREFARWTERLVPRAGDILYSREGDWGISAPVPEGVTLCISQRMMIFRPKKRIHSPYLMWQLNCEHVLRQGFFDVLGSTVPHVNIGTIANYQLVIPPPQEQEAIAVHVDLLHSKFKEAKRQIESQIQTLQTLRSTLIAHAVTGKIAIPAATA